MVRGLFLAIIATSFLFAGSMQFQNSIPRDNDKPVLVVVERDGCPWCRKMKNETLQNEAVINDLNGFHVVVMDQAKWNRLGFENVQSVPTMFFLDNEKRVLLKSVGFWDAQDFRVDIRNAKAKMPQ